MRQAFQSVYCTLVLLRPAFADSSAHISYKHISQYLRTMDSQEHFRPNHHPEAVIHGRTKWVKPMKRIESNDLKSNRAARELFAFVVAVERQYGAEQARISAEDWIEELERLAIDRGRVDKDTIRYHAILRVSERISRGRRLCWVFENVQTSRIQLQTNFSIQNEEMDETGRTFFEIRIETRPAFPVGLCNAFETRISLTPQKLMM